MRKADISRLEEPYPDDLSPSDLNMMRALGINLPAWTSLQTEIFNDFVQQAPYGVGWWAPHPGTKRRILIGDHLFCCASSVAGNLVEASLHWLEFLQAIDRDDNRYRDSVKLDGGFPVYSPPQPQNAFEQLAPEFIRIHEVGLARALSSALDCLGAVVIGIAALPTNILRAGLNDARRELRKVNPKKEGDQSSQFELARNLETAIRDSGPAGWLDWTLDWRNMVVHRGRRTEHGRIVRSPPVLYDSANKEIVRARRISQLPRDPGRSDVEVFREGHDKFVLHEESQVTWRGVRDSTANLIEIAAGYLLQFWRWRRENPGLLTQPREQWPNGPSEDSTGFKGYKPDPAQFALEDALGTVHPMLHRRILAAALDDSKKTEWERFD